MKGDAIELAFIETSHLIIKYLNILKQKAYDKSVLSPKNTWNTPLTPLLGTDVQQFRDAAREAYDVFTRTRTGASLNIDEQKFYQKYIPGVGDTKDILIVCVINTT